jgi:hypothetical protein
MGLRRPDLHNPCPQRALRAKMRTTPPRARKAIYHMHIGRSPRRHLSFGVPRHTGVAWPALRRFNAAWTRLTCCAGSTAISSAEPIAGGGYSVKADEPVETRFDRLVPPISLRLRSGGPCAALAGSEPVPADHRYDRPHSRVGRVTASRPSESSAVRISGRSLQLAYSQSMNRHTPGTISAVPYFVIRSALIGT